MLLELHEVLEGETELKSADAVEDDGDVLAAIGAGDYSFHIFEQGAFGQLTTDDLDGVIDLRLQLVIRHRTVGHLQQLTELLYLLVGDTGKGREVVFRQGTGGILHITRQQQTMAENIDTVFLGYTDKNLTWNDYLLLDRYSNVLAR